MTESWRQLFSSVSVSAAALCGAFYSDVFLREDACVVGSDDIFYGWHATVANFDCIPMITLCKTLVLRKQVFIKVRNFFTMLVTTLMECGGLNQVIFLTLMMFLRKFTVLLTGVSWLVILLGLFPAFTIGFEVGVVPCFNGGLGIPIINLHVLAFGVQVCTPVALSMLFGAFRLLAGIFQYCSGCLKDVLLCIL
ncbi:hypothetical protein PoB_005343800 [Plakobranchus ocellatus]|uniref:Transmembrane protein n=1 Tax=Plakobranchus ocellatus TaxID=259542 RepID=A0AAV4C4V1_9GAST|nr:hypothetical protein PoB_005343800 [Plakobranchus ocellatus]